MSIRLRLVLLALALLLLVSATSSWLLGRAYRAERAAQEQSARITTHALMQLVDRELGWPAAGDASLQPARADRGMTPQASAEAAVRNALAGPGAFGPGDWAGVLMDSAGSIVLTHPADLRNVLSPERAARLHGSVRDASGGWFDIPDARGATQRAYIGKSRQDWAWVTFMPCSILDPACSRELPWIIGAAIVLFLSAGWAMAQAALGQGGAGEAAPWEGVGGPLSPAQQGACLGWQQRMMIVGRLANRFAHEFNNQLGVISNSASLIERRARDPGLQLPVKAMLRSVEAASFITQWLQRLGARQVSRPQPIELQCWLPDLRPALAVVVGKGMALEIAAAPRTLWVHADPGELELALTCVLLSIRGELPGEGSVAIAYGPWEAGDGHLSPPGSEGFAEIRIEARARQPGDPSPAGSRASGAVWMPADSRPALELGFVHRLCQSAGGSAWVMLDAGRSMAVSMLLAPQDGAHP